MAKKYFDNYRLEIAYDYLFSNLKDCEWVNIHDALNITSGDNLPKRLFEPGPYPVYGGGGETGEFHNSFNVDYQTIGIGRVGARCGCVFNIQKKSWVTDNALFVCENKTNLSNDFLRHYLTYSNLGQFANDAMQPVISKTRISGVQLPLLCEQEQSKIVSLLNSIEKNDVIEDKENLDLLKRIKVVDDWEVLTDELINQKELTTQLKQSILQEAIQGKLTEKRRKQNPNTEPASELLKRIKAEKAQLIKDKKIRKEKPLPPITEDEIPFELPESWVWCRLIDIGQPIIGLTYKPSDTSNAGTPVLRANNVVDGKIYMEDLVHVTFKVPANKVASAGDILICVRSGSKRLIGKSALIDQDGLSFGAFMSLIKSSINPYLYHFLLSDCFKNQIDDEKSTGINQLTQGILKSIIIPIPPEKEQEVIIQHLQELSNKCSDLEKEITQSEKHANMLMQAVLKEAFESKMEEAHA